MQSQQAQQKLTNVSAQQIQDQLHQLKAIASTRICLKKQDGPKSIKEVEMFTMHPPAGFMQDDALEMVKEIGEEYKRFTDRVFMQKDGTILCLTHKAAKMLAMYGWTVDAATPLMAIYPSC